MNKVEIKARLEEAYSDFLKFIDGLSADEFDYAPEGKWNAGQQAIHLIKSTKPLVKALGLPKFLLKQQFGKTNRDGRNYEQVVERYKEKLATATMEAPAKFKPEAENFINPIYCPSISSSDFGFCPISLIVPSFRIFKVSASSSGFSFLARQ